MKILNRAKSIYSDEYFISEDIKFDVGLMYLRVDNQWRECDESTRSINLSGMADSQGNKIFASLSEDGKGGDMFILGDERLKYIAMIRKNQLMAKQQDTYGSLIGLGYAETNKWKVIGVQQ